MPRERSTYICQGCGYQSPKWLGRCPDCGAWASLVEEAPPAAPQAQGPRRAEPVALGAVCGSAVPRAGTGSAELDRVLGGGLVRGSVVLIAGEPGIGKSTLLMQLSGALQGPVLYVCAEESPEQVGLRAQRLGINGPSVLLYGENLLEAVLQEAQKRAPQCLVVDSVQSIYTAQLSSAPGAVGQVRECAARLMQFAKLTGVVVLLVGHVTKEGLVAGPRVLEHIVDVVLYFEGPKAHPYRVLRAVKNRFGSTNEIGVFEMTEQGLLEVQNPSELFLSERPQGASGSVVAASLEGTRPLLVELQALVSQSPFSTPRRSALGLELQRVNLLLAVLEKAEGLRLLGMDVFLNVVGGLRLQEPAIDLAVLAAVVSSFRDRPVEPDWVVFGEVGLSGEVRAVGQAEARLREAAKVGFRRALLPWGNHQRLKGRTPEAIELHPVKGLREALQVLALS